ncbi:hypothetical protein SGMN_31660 [Stenotrophomonas geniculata]
MTAAISTRYSAKKYSSRRGIDSMRSINEALGDTPELPFWLPGSGICGGPAWHPLKPGGYVASLWPAVEAAGQARHYTPWLTSIGLPAGRRRSRPDRAFGPPWIPVANGGPGATA